LTSSIDRLKEIYDSLRLWKEELPTPEKLFENLREKMNTLKRKGFDVLSSSLYAKDYLNSEIFADNLNRIQNEISAEFKASFKFAAETISELLALASMRGIAILTSGEALIKTIARAFRDKAKNLLVYATNAGLAKTMLKLFVVLILNVELGNLDQTLVDIIVNFLQNVHIPLIPHDASWQAFFGQISPEIFSIAPEVLHKSAKVLVICP
jgi:hypothetical protein